MAKDITILVGTAGQGVMRSADGGQSWRRVGITQGIHSDAVVRCLTPVPDSDGGNDGGGNGTGAGKGSVLAGCDRGILRSDDRGETWRRIDTPLNDTAVWAIAFDPSHPAIGFAGTGTPDPCRIYRTRDGGASWEQRPVEVAAECPAVGVPRVTGIAIDPNNGSSVWVGIEVDGLRHSSDGGDTWSTVPHRDIPNLDIHNVAVTAGPPHRIIVMVNDDVFLSDDDGGNWRSLGVRQNFPLGYPRGIRVKADAPQTIYTTFGDTTPGSTGVVMRSDDAGATWANLPLPVEPNTAMWVVNSQPENPDFLLAGSRYGYLYQSDDAGRSWDKMAREFSEISSVMWFPNAD